MKKEQFINDLMIVPNFLLSDYVKIGLTDEELLVILQIISLKSQNQKVTTDAIEKRINIEKEQVHKIITDLLEKNLIEVIQINEGYTIVIEKIYDKLYELNNFQYQIKNIELKLNKKLTSDELEIINSWNMNNIDQNLIDIEIDNAINNGKANIEYINQNIINKSKENDYSVTKTIAIEKIKLF